MRKLVLAGFIVALVSACSHKNKVEDTPAPSNAPATKDQAPAKEKKKKKMNTASIASATVKCTHNQDERVIEIKDKDGGGCETMYTKMGETKSIATAGHGHDHCKEVSAKVQEHLSSAGFTCQ